MTLSLKPHEYRRDPNGNAILTKLNPYIRLRQLGGDEPPIFIQGGQFMYEDSTVIPKDKLPAWVLEELTKITPKAKKEVGIGDLKV